MFIACSFNLSCSRGHFNFLLPLRVLWCTFENVISCIFLILQVILVTRVFQQRILVKAQGEHVNLHSSEKQMQTNQTKEYDQPL